MKERAGRLEGRRITLGVTGSIAAYKAVIVARLLVKEGARVRVVMTASASRFVGPITFAGISGEPVLTDMFDAETGGERHVALAAESDLVLVVPATADMLARFATGRADDLLTATVLCSFRPLLIAPAMHPLMWSHPATQRNVTVLQSTSGVELVGPVDGEVASGEVGVGRMADPEEILARVIARLSSRDLEGTRLVVTAGPTVEDIDPVRFVSNRSSGKMGFAIAAQAASRGASVTLISGPVALETPRGVSRVDVRSAMEMRDAVRASLGKDLDQADVLVMSAAVGDYRPAQALASKLKRGEQDDFRLLLLQNPDILAEIGAARSRNRPVLVGFAVETGTDREIVGYARKKLRSKKVDVVVANHAAESMGREDNRVLIVGERSVEALELMPKRDVANRLLDWVQKRLAEPPATSAVAPKKRRSRARR